jgi:hypothetical protein
VFYAPHRGPEHANRESLVLQTERRLSIAGGLIGEYFEAKAGEGGRLLLEKGVYFVQGRYQLQHERAENLFLPGPVEP